MSQPLQIYLAAVYTNEYMPGGNGYAAFNDVERQVAKRAQGHHILESYHYVHKPKYVNSMRENGAKVFLDSGAFSAWTLGVELRVQDYVNYIKRNQDIIRVEDGNLMASVLDGIGDPQKTFENQMEMERLGVRPLPCFHFGEDPRYLEWYVQNYDYITIGGMVGKSVPDLISWLDHVWQKYMMDGSGNPRLKVHGFGITTTAIMERYPWYSCDSSSWIQATAFGALVLPGKGVLHVSEKSPNRHNAGQHFFSLSPIERQHMQAYLESKGFSEERLSNTYQSRAAWNMMAYMEINTLINDAKSCQRLNLVRELF